MSVDEKAVQILLGTYWSPKGWIPDGQRKTGAEAFAYAKAAGVMFDPVNVTHDELVARAKRIRRAVSMRQVTDAFLGSLSSRRLELRSALGSWAYLSHCPDHRFWAWEKWCGTCRWHQAAAYEDLNVLNLERLKWGGVRRDDLLYVVFDLEQFQTADPCLPTEEDIAILRRVLKTIGQVPPGTTATALQKHLAGIIRSNKAEREVLIGILGICGILQTEKHVGYNRRFTPYAQRELPARRFIDQTYPACWWTGKDGVNLSAVSQFFGYVL